MNTNRMMHPALTSPATIAGASASLGRCAIIAGVVTGVIYLVSPLTMIVAAGLIAVGYYGVRGLERDERRFFLVLYGIAVALRVAAIAGLFLAANRNAASFGTFFGDEQFYLWRSFRLYSVRMGIPISTESFLYAYDQTGYGSYQEILIFLQVLFGPIPYGIHLLNAVLFLASVVILYRLVRVSYGSTTALVGFAYLLFLPSLFMWSVSALKESLYLFMTSLVVFCTMASVRARTWSRRAVAFVLLIALGSVLETLRAAGRVSMLGGAAVAYALRLVSLRRWAMALAAAIVVGAIAWLAWHGVPPRVQSQLQASARYHRGHVLTPGHSYKLLDQRFYSSAWTPLAFPDMTPPETARYVVRALLHFVVEPLPWTIVSRLELAYLPELMVWYTAVLLALVGLVAGYRRDPLLTCVLFSFSVVSGGIIALNSGNVGTLVRHRALIAPYLGWISALGLVALLAASRRFERPAHS